MNTKALETNQLCKNFKGLEAVKNVNLSVEEGEYRAIIGPNGAGKTTLFNLISGRLACSSGEIYAYGDEITSLSTHDRTRHGIARTFQITNLFSSLSLFKNIFLAVQSTDQQAKFSMWSPVNQWEQIKRDSEKILEQWDMLEQAHMPVKDLSYGDRRLIELVLALATNPKILLLDEPTAGLAPEETEEITKVIENLDRNMTVLLIEHDMNTALRLVDRVTVMNQGQILAEGTVEQIQRNRSVQEIYFGHE